jgi:methylmalonyl-CoA mutase, N-terminal domain
VGVNAFREETETPPPILSMDPRLEAEQVERLKAFRAARNAAKTREVLARLQSDAREDRNLMPAIVEAVSGNATLGEIVGSLKEIYGEHRPGN